MSRAVLSNPSGNSKLMTLFARVEKWASKPFDSNMNVGGWFAFFGLLVVLSIFWNTILLTIKEQ